MQQVTSGKNHYRRQTGPSYKQEKILNMNQLFSADGHYLAYVTWNDVEMGAIWQLDLQYESRSAKLTTTKAIYREPAYSPKDPKVLVFRKEEGNTNQGYTNTLEPGIYLMHTDREEAPEKITEEGMFPMFNADASLHLLPERRLPVRRSYQNTRVSQPSREDKREIVTSKYAQRIVPGPDDQWVAFTNLYKVLCSSFLCLVRHLIWTGSPNPFR